MQPCWAWHMQNLYLEMGILYSVRCPSYAITATPEAPPAPHHRIQTQTKGQSSQLFTAPPQFRLKLVPKSI